jgi:hypothetical protein
LQVGVAGLVEQLVSDDDLDVLLHKFEVVD